MSAGGGWVFFQDGEPEDRHEGPAAGEAGSEEAGEREEGPWAAAGGATPSAGKRWLLSGPGCTNFMQQEPQL